MELKIKIKEVVEYERPLTREEWLICSYHDQCRFPCTDTYLNDIGLKFDSKKNFDDSTKDWGIGTFRKETIRDATPEESAAYYLVKGIDLSFFEGSVIGNRVGKKYNEAWDLLYDKEIILELI